MTNRWGKLIQNGRGGRTPTFHTGTCQHREGSATATAAQNRAIPACGPCASPFTHFGLTHRPFEALERLIGLAPSEWPVMTVHGVR